MLTLNTSGKNPSIFGANEDGSPSQVSLDVSYGEFGQKTGMLPAEGAGAIGEFVKGSKRGITEFVRSSAKTVGAKSTERSMERILASNADWFPSERKSVFESIANFSGATIGNYAPMMAAQAAAAALTGGGSVEAQLGARVGMLIYAGESSAKRMVVDAVAKSITRTAARSAIKETAKFAYSQYAGAAAGSAVAYVQSYGDNRQRIDELLPDMSPTEKYGLAILLTAGQSLIEQAGVERMFGKEIAKRQILESAIRSAGRDGVSRLGIQTMGVLKPFAKSMAQAGATEGVEGVLQKAAFDFPVAMLGGDTSKMDMSASAYAREFAQNAAGGLVIGTLPSTMNAMHNMRAQQFLDTSDESINTGVKAEVNKSNLVVNGVAAVDEVAKQKSDDTFKAFRDSLPDGQKPVGDLIENLAYRWAYVERQAGNATFRPESVIETLKMAMLQDSEHGVNLSNIASDGERSGKSASEIHAEQMKYIRTNMQDASGLLHSVQERAELIQANRELAAIRQDLQKRAPVITEAEAQRVADVASAAVVLPGLKAGDQIPAAQLAYAFRDNPELLQRAYVAGSVQGVKYGSSKVTLVINDDLSATVQKPGALKTGVEQVGQQPLTGQPVLKTTAGAKAEGQQQQLGQILGGRDEQYDGVRFSSTDDLAAARSEIVSASRRYQRLENFDTRFKLASGSPAQQADMDAMKEAARKMGFKSTEVNAMRPDELAALMPQGWRPGVPVDQSAAEQVAGSVQSMDEFMAERVGQQIEAERAAEVAYQAAQEEAKAAALKADYDSRLKAESDAQIERARVKLEALRDARALAERDAVAEFNKRYPEAASRSLEARRAATLKEAAQKVRQQVALREMPTETDLTLPGRLEAMASQPAIVGQELTAEQRVRQTEGFKSLDEAMAALEASDPGLAKKLSDLRRSEQSLRVAMALRMIPDEPQVLRQGIYGQYIPGVQLALFYKDADTSTIVHEIFHHFIENRLLPNSIHDALTQAFAVKGVEGEEDRWTLAAKENAANAFLAYVLNNKPPKGKLVMAFNFIKASIAAHLDDMNTKVMSGVDGKGYLLDSGKPLEIPEKLARAFRQGLEARKPDEAAVIYGRALTESMMNSGYADDQQIDNEVNATAASIAAMPGVEISEPDLLIRTTLELNQTTFGGIKDYRGLNAFQKITLANMLKADLDAMTDTTTPITKVMPDGFRTREQRIVDEAVLKQGSPSVNDEAYLKAVEAGDTTTAQRMVDEAAKAAGYNVRVFHGTGDVLKSGHTIGDRDFTEFRPSKMGALGPGVYVAPDENNAASYAARFKTPRLIKAYARIKKPFKGGTVAEVGNRLFSQFPADTDDGTIKKLLASGYDAVWADTPETTRFGVVDPEINILDPAAIKSADPITRDDQGNVIPLSKRFNPSSNSILFSANKAAREYMSGDPAARKAAREKLKAMGVSDETLNPKPKSANAARVVVMKQYAEAYGLDLKADKDFILDSMRGAALQLFGERATKVVDGKRVASLSGLTAEELAQLSPDDSVFESTDEELQAQQRAAADGVLAVEAFKSTWGMTADSVQKQIGRGGTALLRWLNRYGQNFYTLVDMLFGKDANGPMQRIAQNMRNGVKLAQQAHERWVSDFEAAIKAAGYQQPIEFAKVVDVAGRKMTRSQVMGIYTTAGWGETMDSKDMDALIRSEEFGTKEETLRVAQAAVDYVRNVEPGLDKVARWADQRMREQYARSREIALAQGRDIPFEHEGPYMPRVYKDGSLDDGSATAFLENFHAGDPRFNEPSGPDRMVDSERSFKARGNRSRYGMELDYITLVDRHMRTLNHFNANAEWVHDALTLMQDQVVNGERVNALRRAFIDKFGDASYYDQLVDFVKRASRPQGRLREESTDHTFDRVLRYLNRSAAPAFLSWNFWTPMIQPVSGFHVIGQMGFKHAPRYAREVWTMMKQLKNNGSGTAWIGAMEGTDAYKFVQQRSPTQAAMFRSMAERQMKIGLEALQQNPFNMYGKKIAGVSIGNLIENGLVPMQFTDAMFRLSAWKTAYEVRYEEAAKTLRNDEEALQREATAYADRIVGYSMNPADQNEQSLGISEGSDAWKSITLFSGQPMAEFRAFMNEVVMPMVSTYADSRRAGSSRPGALAKSARRLTTSDTMNRYLFTMALPGMALGLVSRKRLPTFREFIGDITVGGLSTKVPIIGPLVWASALYGFTTSEGLTTLGPLKSAAAFIDDIANAVTSPFDEADDEQDSKETNWWKVADRARKSATIITRTPDYPARVLLRSAEAHFGDGEPLMESIGRGIGVAKQ